MSSHVLGIIIGGLVPAILYGVSGIFSKESTKEGIGLGLYLMITGISIAVVGLGFFVYQSDTTLSLRSAFYASLFGVTWAIGSSLVAIGLTTFGMPLSTLVPLYNMNTLVTVLLALWVFAEWKEVHIAPLLLGSFCIIIGGVLVSRA